MLISIWIGIWILGYIFFTCLRIILLIGYVHTAGCPRIHTVFYTREHVDYLLNREFKVATTLSFATYLCMRRACVCGIGWNRELYPYDSIGFSMEIRPVPEYSNWPPATFVRLIVCIALATITEDDRIWWGNGRLLQPAVPGWRKAGHKYTRQLHNKYSYKSGHCNVFSGQPTNSTCGLSCLMKELCIFEQSAMQCNVCMRRANDSGWGFPTIKFH